MQCICLAVCRIGKRIVSPVRTVVIYAIPGSACPGYASTFFGCLKSHQLKIPTEKALYGYRFLLQVFLHHNQKKGVPMIKLMKKVVLISAVLAVGSQAQYYQGNARMSALGGTFNMDDMSDILRYPVYMNTYKNSIQATFTSPIMGVKSVGDMLSIGIVANRNFVLDNSADGFYTVGNATLDAFNGATLPAMTTQRVPHILLGFDLDAVSLGFDLFYEYAGSHYKSETTTSPSVTTEITSASRNPGFIASALFGPEDIPITVKAGLSFPGIGGKSDDGTTKTELKSDKGLFFEAGAEATMPVSDFSLTVGTDLNFESYAFTVGDADPATIYGKNRTALYGGLEGKMLSDAQWGALATIYYGNTKTTTAADTTGTPYFTFALSGGVENTWSNVWKFDECTARAGCTFSATTPGSTVKNAAVDAKAGLQTTYAPFTPTVGAGVKKGAFQLDVTINPTAWSGLVSGPAVGMVTGTLTF